MEHQKELFIQFMENNMPSEPFDPDKVLAAAREAVPDYQPSEQFTKGMDKLLQKSKRRARKDTVKRFFSRRGVPQVAVSLSVIICALFIAQANNGAIFDLLFQTHQTHTGVELTEQVREELLVDKLEEIDMQVYFPKYLPKGYTISNIETSVQKVSFRLENENNFILIVERPLNGYSAKVALDSEDTPLEEVTINEHTGFYNFKDGIYSLYFFDNNNFYKIKTNNLSKTEMIQIAESFEMIV